MFDDMRRSSNVDFSKYSQVDIKENIPDQKLL